MSNIARNVQTLLEQVTAAARSAGRSATDITVVAVSKGHPVADIRLAAAAGITDIGENRVQEALPKFAEIGRLVRWHMVGTLQGNKVRQALSFADLIHSIDRLSLAQEVSRTAVQAGQTVTGLVQVNASGEASKHGVRPVDAIDFLRQVHALPGLRMSGFMTIGPLHPDPEEARPAFRQVAALYRTADKLRLPGVEMRWLSMGMSGDYAVAISEGANLVRVGTAVFGSRETRGPSA